MAKTIGTLADALDSFLSAHLAGLDIEVRTSALADYARGLGLEAGSKSLMSVARSVAPDNVESCRQRMQRALARSQFEAPAVFERLQHTVGQEAGRHIQALCIDDTGVAKQGDKSVGVQRQYSGTLGKVGNCQVITTLHALSNFDSYCLGARLYLPESWASDEARRELAQIPDDVQFLTKPEAAAKLIEEAIENGFPKRPVVADAAYGDSRDFRDHLQSLGLDFAVAISSQTLVWPPGIKPEVRPRTGSRGPTPTRYLGPQGEMPISVGDIAQQLLDDRKFRKTTWRHGTKGELSGKFARVRVHSAERRTKGVPPSDEMWLIVELNSQKDRPFKFYFSSLPENTPMKVLVDLIKMRWRIEMDYRDMKQHLGFDCYEGRSWGGLHRHLAMVFLMHTFIALNRERFSPRSTTTLDLEPVLSSAEARHRSLA